VKIGAFYQSVREYRNGYGSMVAAVDDQNHYAGVLPPEMLHEAHTRDDLDWNEAGDLPGATDKFLARMIAAGEPLAWVEIELED
jgi:hypothetical protein